MIGAPLGCSVVGTAWSECSLPTLGKLLIITTVEMVVIQGLYFLANQSFDIKSGLAELNLVVGAILIPATVTLLIKDKVHNNLDGSRRHHFYKAPGKMDSRDNLYVVPSKTIELVSFSFRF